MCPINALTHRSLLITTSMFTYFNFYKSATDSKKKIITKGLKFYLFNWLLIGGITYYIANIVIHDNANPVILQDYLLSNKYNGLVLYLLIAVVMPLIEEGAFRLGLSFKKKDVIIALPLLSLYLFSLMFSLFGISDTIIRISLPIIMLTIFITCLKIPETFFQSLKEKKGTLIIYISTILFALIHITNYQITDLKYFPIYCMLCIPQLAGGVTATYFRLNLGFWYACGFHIIANTLIFVIR